MGGRCSEKGDVLAAGRAAWGVCTGRAVKGDEHREAMEKQHETRKRLEQQATKAGGRGRGRRQGCARCPLLAGNRIFIDAENSAGGRNAPRASGGQAGALMSWDGSDGKVCQAGYGQRVPSQGGRGRDGWVGRVGVNGKMRCWAGLPAQGAGRARNGGDESVSRRCGPPRGQASSRGKRGGAGQGAAQPPAVHCRVRGPPPEKGARADKSGGSNGAEPAGARCHLSRPAGRLSLSRARQHSCLARRHPAGRTHTQGAASCWGAASSQLGSQRQGHQTRN